MAEGGFGPSNRAPQPAPRDAQRRKRRVVKPDSWPRYMKEKPISTGVAYYWTPHDRDLAAGCPLRPEPLGREYGAAVARANLLNLHLDAWRSGRGGIDIPEARAHFGTVRWLFDTYLKSPSFLNKVSERSQYEYRRALYRIEDIPTKNGVTVGELPVSSITPGAVDKIYAKLQIGPRGRRRRQANLSVDVARRVWKVMRRAHPEIIPAENPWSGVERDLRKTTKAAATREEAYTLAHQLAKAGEPHLGAAALICFEWHQRPEHVLSGEITWSDYRPPHRPDAVFVRHPKTGEKGWLPLETLPSQGATPVQLYPELEEFLSKLEWRGLPIVLTSGRRGPARPYSSEHAERKVREARTAASLGEHVTLDACRHGGLTELGDSGATEAQTMAASMHKTPSAARLYVKRTETQRAEAALLRRAHVERRRSGVKLSGNAEADRQEKKK